MEFSIAGDKSTFNVKASQWPIWQARYSDRICLCGGQEVIEGDITVAPDDQSNFSLEEERIRIINNQIFSYLLLSINDPDFFKTVFNSKTGSLKKGDAHLASENINDKFTKKTIEEKIRIKIRL